MLQKGDALECFHRPEQWRVLHQEVKLRMTKTVPRRWIWYRRKAAK
jgi:hypothetical protein